MKRAMLCGFAAAVALSSILLAACEPQAPVELSLTATFDAASVASVASVAPAG